MSEQRPPMSNVFLTMLHKMGGTDDAFGRSTGVMKELTKG